MPRLTLSPRSHADLIEIWSYIADDSEANADAFIDKLDAVLRMLAQQPGTGRRREDLAFGIRSFPVGRYMVFYRSSERTVEIVRVLHAARNIEPLFEEDD